MEKLKTKTELTEREEKIMEEVFGETREETIAALKKAEEEIERGEFKELDTVFKELRRKYEF